MNKGFTLIEVFIVIILFSVLALSVLWIFSTSLKIWGTGLDRTQIRQEAGAALGRIIRELGQTASVSAATANQITFLADLDGNGSDETVSLNVSGGNLTRTEGAVTTLLASNVQTFGLSYRDVNNVLLTPPADTDTQPERDQIRIVTVTLTMDKDEETLTLASSAYARNQ